jgi:hypothetical protein
LFVKSYENRRGERKYQVYLRPEEARRIVEGDTESLRRMLADELGMALKTRQSPRPDEPRDVGALAEEIAESLGPAVGRRGARSTS